MPVVEDPVAVRAVPEPDRLPTLTEVVQLAADPWAAASRLATGQPDPAVLPQPVDLPGARAPTMLLAEVLAAPTQLPTALPANAPTMADPVTMAPPPAWDEEQLTHRVLAVLEQRLDGLFEARLREALAPALARAADGLIRDLRPELTQALHDLVHDAVARALQEAPPR